MPRLDLKNPSGQFVKGNPDYVFLPERVPFSAQDLRDLADEIDLLNKQNAEIRKANSSSLE